MKKLLFTFTLQLLLVIGFAQNFNVGDKVEIFNSGGWYKGSVVETGSGNMAGYFSVKYDGHTQLQWIKASNIKIQNRPDDANNTSGPRNGTYIILSYGNPNNPLRLGYFQINNGEYTNYNMAKKILGKGAFVYNSNNKRILWTSGPFKDENWGGSFEIEREGKTHIIRLNRVTIGSNSTDSNQ